MLFVDIIIVVVIAIVFLGCKELFGLDGHFQSYCVDCYVFEHSFVR